MPNSGNSNNSLKVIIWTGIFAVLVAIVNGYFSQKGKTGIKPDENNMPTYINGNNNNDNKIINGNNNIINETKILRENLTRTSILSANILQYVKPNVKQKYVTELLGIPLNEEFLDNKSYKIFYYKFDNARMRLLISKEDVVAICLLIDNSSSEIFSLPKFDDYFEYKEFGLGNATWADIIAFVGPNKVLVTETGTCLRLYADIYGGRQGGYYYHIFGSTSEFPDYKSLKPEESGLSFNAPVKIFEPNKFKVNFYTISILNSKELDNIEAYDLTPNSCTDKLF